MNHLTLSLLFICASSLLLGQNQRPLIHNLMLDQSSPDRLELRFTLEDPDNAQVQVSLLVSEKDKNTFADISSQADGDVGLVTVSPEEKIIHWDYGNFVNENGSYTIKIVADDGESIDIQSLVDRVDSNRMRRDLEKIVGIRHRTANPSHLTFTKNFIRDSFLHYGLETKTLSFYFNNNYNGENIEGKISASSASDTVFIIDGHFDGVADSPGADDNGSAVVGMLEAMRILSEYEFNHTVKFIGFDLEEAGLIGSNHYVNVDGIADDEHIGGVLNFEMIGYYDNSPNSQTLPAGFNILYPQVAQQISNDQFRGNFITNVGIQSHPALNVAFEAAAAAYVPELKVISILAPTQWLSLTPDLGRSDHAPFWQAGHPALMLTDGSNFRNPYYHTPNDTVGTLNFTFMSRVVQASLATIARLAGIKHSSSVTSDVQLTTSSRKFFDCDPIVYPNPSTDFLHVDLADCLTANARIRILNMSGISLLEKNLSPGQSLNIPIADWPTGNYLLWIEDGSRSFQTKLIVER